MRLHKRELQMTAQEARAMAAEERPDEPMDTECPVCDEVHERHPDDPPTCSQDCWQAFLQDEEPEL